jgi:hypothetical protein
MAGQQLTPAQLMAMIAQQIMAEELSSDEEDSSSDDEPEPTAAANPASSKPSESKTGKGRAKKEKGAYRLRKAPRRDLYWVVSTDSGEKHSKDPLPKKRAEAQMRALYAAKAKRGGQYFNPLVSAAKGTLKEDVAKATEEQAARLSREQAAYKERVAKATEAPEWIKGLESGVETVASLGEKLPGVGKAFEMGNQLRRELFGSISDSHQGSGKHPLLRGGYGLQDLVHDMALAMLKLAPMLDSPQQAEVRKIWDYQDKQARGKSYSDEVNEMLLARLNHLYEKEVLPRLPSEFPSLTGGRRKFRGAGFLDWLRNKAAAAAKTVSDAGQAVVGRVKDVFRGIRLDYSPRVRKLLAAVGDKQIVAMAVRRDPLPGPLTTVLNLGTLGKWDEVRQRFNYDKVFHLALEVVVDMGESEARFVVEKNQVINIAPAAGTSKDTEYKRVQGTPVNLNEMLERTKERMGTDAFFKYDAFHNNCQDFILQILAANDLLTPALQSFIKQPLGDVLSALPSYAERVAKIATDLGGLADVAVQGRGKMVKMKPKAFFAEHKKLVGLLNSVGNKLQKEAKEQAAEAKGVAKKLKKGGSGKGASGSKRQRGDDDGTNGAPKGKRARQEDSSDEDDDERKEPDSDFEEEGKEDDDPISLGEAPAPLEGNALRAARRQMILGSLQGANEAIAREAFIEAYRRGWIGARNQDERIEHFLSSVARIGRFGLAANQIRRRIADLIASGLSDDDVDALPAPGAAPDDTDSEGEAEDRTGRGKKRGRRPQKKKISGGVGFAADTTEADLVLDEGRYRELMGMMKTRQQWDALRAKRPTLQPYEEYAANYEKLARQRSMGDPQFAQKMEASRQETAETNAAYQEFYAANPEYEPVSCKFDEEGNPAAPETVPRGECKRRQALAAENLRQSTTMGKIVSGLTQVGDLATEFVGNVPGIGKIASSVYKQFAPPGSAFYDPSKSFGEKAIGSISDAIGFGRPGAKFMNQLEDLGISPDDYLAIATRKARKLGLNAETLTFSTDKRHKLMIKDEDGDWVHFGAPGYGDYILYTMTDDPEADKHRRAYRKRAENIKGKWRYDEYSPNYLAIHVLW